MHLAEEQIVRYLDREMTAVEAESVAAHLGGCVACRERVTRVERTLGAASEVFRTPVEAGSGAASRARLQDRMRASAGSQGGWRAGRVRRLALAAVLLIAVGIGLLAGRGKHVDQSMAGDEPIRALTPGATRPVTLGEICPAADDDDLDPSVPAMKQTAVLREYGLTLDGPQKAYQIDYLVNPQLGGTDDLKNLWPQPQREGPWNARAKDELEKHLHAMVCERRVELTVAQQEIATDWIAAYKKYFGRLPV